MEISPNKQLLHFKLYSDLNSVMNSHATSCPEHAVHAICPLVAVLVTISTVIIPTGSLNECDCGTTFHVLM